MRFSKPVDREVTSADVKYAVERAYTANVAGPYVRAYFGDVIGAPKEPATTARSAASRRPMIRRSSSS